MLNIGLTGGIGSGKTLIAKLFSTLGVPIYYSDREAKLLYYNPEIKSQVIALLGSQAYHNQKINKKYISEKIFNDKQLLQEINAIFHPQVRSHYKHWVNQQDSPIVIQESAILFETQQHDNFDLTILVTAPQDIRIQRVQLRDNTTKEKILDRMSNQLSDEQKSKLSDYIIVNDGKSQVIPQVINIYHKLQSLHSSKE